MPDPAEEIRDHFRLRHELAAGPCPSEPDADPPAGPPEHGRAAYADWRTEVLGLVGSHAGASTVARG
jgi:hypothetical protein